MRRLLTLLAVLAALGLIAVVLVLAVSRISDFDLPQADQQSVTFTQGGHTLEGTLITTPEDVVRHARKITFQLAEVAVPRNIFG